MSEVEAASEQFNEVKLDDCCATENIESPPSNNPEHLCVTIGATVPTGFEQTAADEVREKLGSQSRISKDRGKIYFDISVESLSKVHGLRSVDNLFVVVQEFRDYQFKETKEDVLKDFEDLAGKLPWSDPLKVWKINTSFKKKKTKRKKLTQQNIISKEKVDDEQGDLRAEKNVEEQVTNYTMEEVLETIENQDGIIDETPILAFSKIVSEIPSAIEKEKGLNESHKEEAESQVLKFRVTCNRAGENHSFTSNEAARDFGGAVQDYFKWKADMTNFDVEVLLNVHNNEIVVGIALTEESLHRRNITHFGPTTLRSTLAYGMLRLCSPQPTDIIIDPMCGTGAIPIEGAAEWPNCYHIAGDNNPLAVKRAANNILSLLTKSQVKESKAFWGLPIDAIQWDICNLPLRTGSVDIIVTDMPFGKRIGSKKRNWNLYPSCLQEMSRVCRPGTGRAVLLTQDRKCFAKALSSMGHVWRKVHTVWVNIGGLHAAVYLLKRTTQVFIHPAELQHDREMP
ncbi:tRNA (guanine(6)-N2)-methyltransferase THUMP3 isoform X1 [Monodelphis domestica]|uniref:tRNA (guanine(6)-N(2))-methyltransferase THUMP3 n=1 Tax=Monodelphis domestica TaxID=13616 RepID=F6QGW7_MONDO|nr:tRNA (guanine(6)-N2)-methyltransferase THUMP3 isoform X1 [Monodelphis domestica]XP_007500212.1 tRNA (guanine(6)-N2)-methyltransferase THUMP3 isoform X1 [Monodelphis domestica]XP_007500213.1 tRNA (guanine(6)-N2)-methyltransferase THUMP3 isoform X1 [Monodelphis domestica]XP_007500214.1 tRNA (guanine(6)-N2)-methyltransferase THUMP3 isoform X1 [Monodelphis domestica]XP_007500215.1 tRNA (guanine(6)-N2)-methyltransferase THUMP3 isoform X1 [Monodelphis domestica]XP_056660567.1 tRNA (guanine(6)-N2)